MKWRVAFFCAVTLLGALHWAGNRPVHHADGILVADAPLQEMLEQPLPAFHKSDYNIAPLAHFSLQARVLSRANYRFDRGAVLAPVDLALGWGGMSDNTVLQQINISQSARFFFWNAQVLPLPMDQLIASSANMHLIPANDTIERAIKRTRVGDLVSFNGYLVEVSGTDGFHWRSSLSRTDTGDGACELVWVEQFTIAPR